MPSDAVSSPAGPARPARAKASTPNTAAAVSLARLNTAWFIAFVYLQEIFWLAASRIQADGYDEFYALAPFYWDLFLQFCAITVGFALLAVISARLVSPLPRITISRPFYYLIVSIAIVLNLYNGISLAGDARYTSGSLVGTAGIIYALGGAAKLAAMIIMIRQRLAEDWRTPKLLVGAFILSFGLTVDGLAGALSLAMFIVLIAKRITIRHPIRASIIGLAAIGMLWIGLNAKFVALPDYFTPEFMVRWTIARFAIQAEHMYTYISGLSIIGNEVTYFELLERMNTNRLDILFGNLPYIEFPRSISEALYYDMYGRFESGSSPGLLLGSYLMGAAGWLMPLVYCFIFVQFFQGSVARLSLVKLFACSIVLKQLYTNISEYQVLVSPTALVMLTAFIACLIVVRPARRLRKSPPRPAPARTLA